MVSTLTRRQAYHLYHYYWNSIPIAPPRYFHLLFTPSFPLPISLNVPVCHHHLHSGFDFHSKFSCIVCSYDSIALRHSLVNEFLQFTSMGQPERCDSKMIKLLTLACGKIWYGDIAN
ncbi:hypothetical protein Tco_0885014 [Tanacetum coccineum]